MKKLFVFCAVTGMFLASVAFSAETIKDLKLSDYISIALQNNPRIKSSTAQYDQSLASVAQSRSQLLPGISARGETNLKDPQINSRTALPNTSIGYDASISASQTVFSFGKYNCRFKSSQLQSRASNMDLTATRQAVIMDATAAYYNYLLSLDILKVNSELVENAQRHLDQAKALVEVGKQASYTVTKSQVDLADSKVNLLKAVNAVKLAKIDLDNIAGLQMDDSLRFTDSLTEKEQDISLTKALTEAVNNRPDYLASKLRVESAAMNQKAAKSAFFPEFSVSAGLGYGKYDKNSWDNNWSAGASVSVPIFSGGAISASYDQAMAATSKASADLAVAQQTLQTEVRKNFLAKEEALQQIDATEILLQQAKEGLYLSEERYQAGAGISLEITDARAAYANAAISHAQALYDYHVAHVNLLGSIGILDNK